MSTKPDTLLIVDDDRRTRALLAARLETQGYAVSIATTGRQALEMLNAQPCDLVLLDLMMPEMSGFEVLNRLMVDPEMRRIPVIVVSAYDKAQNGTLQLPGVKEVLPKGKVNAIVVRALLEKLGVASEPAHLRV